MRLRTGLLWFLVNSFVYFLAPTWYHIYMLAKRYVIGNIGVIFRGYKSMYN